jgi:DNA-binding response OmpR family regulator
MSAPTLYQASGGCGELDLQYKHVLLVDDNQLLASRIRSTLKFLVKTHEFVVTTVATGADAVRAVMAFDFDIIICDMMMPHMAGDMFYLAVQRIKPQMIPRLLFVTEPEDEQVNAYLHSIHGQIVYKPVEAKDLEHAITQVLSRRKRAPGATEIDLDVWWETPCFTNRVADEEDVRAGRAVFYIRPMDNISVQFADIGLPHCAIFTDEKAHQFPVVIVQSERAGDAHYLGFRFLKQGNGICYRRELELLDEPNEIFWQPLDSEQGTDLRATDAVQYVPTEQEEESPISKPFMDFDVEASRSRTRKVLEQAARERCQSNAWW